VGTHWWPGEIIIQKQGWHPVCHKKPTRLRSRNKSSTAGGTTPRKTLRHPPVATVAHHTCTRIPVDLASTSETLTHTRSFDLLVLPATANLRDRCCSNMHIVQDVNTYATPLLYHSLSCSGWPHPSTHTCEVSTIDIKVSTAKLQYKTKATAVPSLQTRKADLHSSLRCSPSWLPSVLFLRSSPPPSPKPLESSTL
jgi:hypothetical protein